jgi:SAM-dependent methyltransferase
MATNPYTPSFYQTYIEESRQSARSVLPHVLRMFEPTSVIDIGCGVGTWLSVLRELGVGRTVGVDGSYVDREQLLIDDGSFHSHDLSRPLRLEQGFDMAMSLEVAEHISGSSANTFVESLTKLAPLVLFSAAIPHQGGDNHVNEQWPEYWIERFAQRQFIGYDCIRPLVWDDASVAYYYAQNTFVFVHRDRLSDYPMLANSVPAAGMLARVHPRRWLEANDPRRQPLRPLVRALPHSLCKALGLRVQRTLRALTAPRLR